MSPGWRFLDHLLVPALHRTIALAEVDAFLCWSESTWISTWRGSPGTFHVHHGVAEGAGGLLAGHLDGVDQCRLGMDDAHAAPAAAAGRLDDYRIADGAAMRTISFGIFRQGAVGTGHAGTPAAFMASLADTLSPIRRMVSAIGADEDKAGGFDPLGEIGVFRQEAVARVDRPGSRSLRPPR